MPYAASYATAQDPPKTMLTDLEASNMSRQMTNKFIRNGMGPRTRGVTGEPEGYIGRPDPEMQMRMGRGMDPRWVDPPGRPGQPGQNDPNASQEGVVTESYENAEITAAAVANRIFARPSDYINALDDPECPLHSVAISLLSNKRVAGTDRFIYILIICVLAIALTCSLYRINKKSTAAQGVV